MWIISAAFLAYVLASLWYIRRLNMRIKSHEAAWNQIEELTDHNKDGDIVIHVKHI